MGVELEGPSYRSYSSFTQFLSCSKAWELGRLQKVAEVPAWYLAGGQAIHSATEVYDRHRWEELGA